MEFLKDINVGQATLDAALIVAGLATLIQIAPIKINPWTAIARAIGRAINGEVIAKVDKLEKDVTQIKDVADERDAKAARSRILRFGDEIIHGTKHSKEHFDDILADMTEYENYCAEHKEFKNNRTQQTSRLILETYQNCLKDHNFI